MSWPGSGGGVVGKGMEYGIQGRKHAVWGEALVRGGWGRRNWLGGRG